MTLTPDDQYVIATTGFDRIRDDSNSWDGYNILLVWPVGQPDQVKVVAATTNEDVTFGCHPRSFYGHRGCRQLLWPSGTPCPRPPP